MRIGIFGGTGTIGHQLLEEFKDEELFIFSRDEYKQARVREAYPNVKMQIGDVRDYRSVLQFMRNGFDYVIFAAAMKRVEMCEKHPDEAVKTNVYGIENVLEAAEIYKPTNLISIGTDKDVEPVNVYGMTKAIQERLVIAAGWNVVRYGNVWGSRGSVVEVFAEQAALGLPLTITDPGMTRFILTKDEAVELIKRGLLTSYKGSTFIKKTKAASILDIANVFSTDHIVTGITKGEKIHECLLSEEEASRAWDIGEFFMLNPEWKFTKPSPKIKRYSSDMVDRYTTEELRRML